MFKAVIQPSIHVYAMLGNINMDKKQHHKTNTKTSVRCMCIVMCVVFELQQSTLRFGCLCWLIVALRVRLIRSGHPTAMVACVGWLVLH